MTSEGDSRRRRTRLRGRLSTWVTVYGVALALIGFWPQPVDSGAGHLLRLISRVFPLLSYERLEFASNILLFVPLGVGLALMLRRSRYLVMPIALLVSLSIESVQAVFIAARTPSVYDIIANVSGAALGLVAVAVVDARRRRGARHAAVAHRRESTMEL